MFNITLLKKEIKTNYKILLLFLALLTMYTTVIIMMFDPDLGKSLEMMAKSIPEVFAVFGMVDSGSTLIEFLANYLYGFILLVIPTICIMIIANRLVTRYIDRGSMSYLLATPHSRKEIIRTQAFMLMTTITSIVIYATTLIILVSQLSFPATLEIDKFIFINIGLLGLLLLIGSVCFFSSCLFNESKVANGVGSGVVIIFILLQMLAQVGDRFSFLKYLTPLTLFDATGIIAGNANSFVMFGILYLMAFLLFYTAITIFSKKDLPI